MHYKPTGVCSQNIEFDIEDNKVKNVHFTGGCNGNLPVSYTHLTLPTIA